MRIHATAFLLATSALTLAVPAYGQDVAAEDENAESSIVVTGTRIVRDGYTAPTPVTVATTEDLVALDTVQHFRCAQQAAAVPELLWPLADCLQLFQLPSAWQCAEPARLGHAGLHPKGAAADADPVGWSAHGTHDLCRTVDTNVIPNLLVQRVDVVTGGASAAWGSDAVAGVVNFVLDKKFTGIKGVAQAGTSQEGDNGNYRLGAAYGSSFSDDRGHVLLSAEYSKNNGMLRSAAGDWPAGLCLCAEHRHQHLCRTRNRPHCLRSRRLAEPLPDHHRRADSAIERAGQDHRCERCAAILLSARSSIPMVQPAPFVNGGDRQVAA